MSFAGPLKDMLRVLGLDDRHLYGDLKEAPCDLLGGVTPRAAMQTLGHEWGRETVYPNIWVDTAKRRALDILKYEGRVVFDDVRYSNEAAAIKDLGGVTVRLFRGEETPAEHPSEEIDFKADRVLYNVGGCTDLFDEVERLLRE
jgi:hypothetical protein